MFFFSFSFITFYSLWEYEYSIQIDPKFIVETKIQKFSFDKGQRYIFFQKKKFQLNTTTSDSIYYEWSIYTTLIWKHLLTIRSCVFIVVTKKIGCAQWSNISKPVNVIWFNRCVHLPISNKEIYFMIFLFNLKKICKKSRKMNERIIFVRKCWIINALKHTIWCWFNGISVNSIQFNFLQRKHS